MSEELQSHPRNGESNVEPLCSSVVTAAVSLIGELSGRMIFHDLVAARQATVRCFVCFIH